MYNIYRNDRALSTKDKSLGGVLLAIIKDCISDNQIHSNGYDDKL
jgi:hypothetical protein